jgi:hypothetical protein
MSDGQKPIEESFVIVNFQLSVMTCCGSRPARMTFWGRPEAEGMVANYAEVEFVPDGSVVPPPRFNRDLKPGVHRIGMWLPMSQFDRVAAILRQGRGVRCYFFKHGDREPVAGIKDWNTIGNPPFEHPAKEPTLQEVAERCSTPTGDDERGSGETVA